MRWGLTPSASIRLGDYKLIEFFGDRADAGNNYRIGDRIELCNLRKDIGETRNLADVESDRGDDAPASRPVRPLHCESHCLVF